MTSHQRSPYSVLASRVVDNYLLSGVVAIAILDAAIKLFDSETQGTVSPRSERRSECFPSDSSQPTLTDPVASIAALSVAAFWKVV